MAPSEVAEYRVLGPVEVVAGGETLRLGAPKQQARWFRQERSSMRCGLCTRSSGYVLEVLPWQVDAYRFEQLACQGRRELEAGRFPEALTALHKALALWRGEMLPDIATLPYFQLAVARLE